MPRCSNFLSCDVPIRIDTYTGCSFNCSYCFISRYYKGKPKPFETAKSVKRFIEGKRTSTTNWCDWNIPLHFGVISDPFQHIEKDHKISFDVLKLFAKTGYPFIITTKSTLIAEKEYLDVLKDCNAIVQLSICSPKYDKYETNAPFFNDRLSILDRLVKNTRRIIVRIQPYHCDIYADVLDHLERYADSGVYGVLVGSAMEGTHDLFCYPDLLGIDYEIIRDCCYDLGLRFYCCDGIMQGDSSTCCGCDKLKGFKVNKANLNYRKSRYSPAMKLSGSAKVFSTISRDVGSYKRYASMSYFDVMSLFKRGK